MKHESMVLFSVDDRKGNIERPSENDLLRREVDSAKRMSGRICHDFNNLISVVQGYASILQGRPYLDMDSMEIVGQIVAASAELAALTGHLGRFADKLGMDLNPLNLNSVVESFFYQENRDIPSGIEVQVHLVHRMPSIMGDERLITDVCRNLWQNALDSMPQGGKIYCQTKIIDAANAKEIFGNHCGPQEYVCLEVRDTGVGMDEHTVANMFAPFFTTKRGKCRGLGAAFVFEILQAHGGLINVSSKPNSGTCVELYFPSCAEATEQSAISNAHEATSRLLIVDDDDMVRLAIQKMLEHLGFDSMPAASGEEALAIYKNSGANISAVILDITMPGLGGVQTYRKLRAINNDIRVIVATGDPSSPAIREIEDLGVTYVIPKPFHTDQLFRAVQKALI